MELKTAIGYLLALIVPLWLLVEQGLYWRSSAKKALRQLEPRRLSSPPRGRVASTPVMRLGHPRKTA
jgi:hypothetical protein